MQTSEDADPNTVRRAAEVLAKERNSDSIKAWLVTGEVKHEEDEITSAYRFFGIDDRTSALDLEVLENQVSFNFGDDPNRLEDARKHFEVLSKHMMGQGQVEMKPNYEIPVGLQNQGNTCYLNSLLQYLFAIRQFRNIILNIDQLKDDVSAEGFQRRRVGGLRVTRQQAIKSQEFVEELNKLFQEMAHAPGPSVYPTWKLACLALVGDSNLARRSTVGGERPNLLMRDSHLGKEIPQETIEELPNDEDSPPMVVENIIVIPDNSSDTTLVDDVVVTPESETANKEEDIPENANDIQVEKEADAVPSVEQPAEESHTTIIDVESAPPKHPDRPPPVPPRPKPHPEQSKNELWREKAEDAAQQQDVTEVIENVLYKTECAIRPSSLGSDDEQQDEIKSLFYGTQKWTYPDKETEDKEELFSIFSLTLATQPKDVYDALHEVFDRRTVELNGKEARRFGTIINAPPILQLVFQRQEYVKEKQETVVIKHHVDLNETIYLDRFLPDTDGEMTTKRQAYWRAKEEYQSHAEQREKHKVPSLQCDDVDALEATYEFVDKLSAKSDPNANGEGETEPDLIKELGLDGEWVDATKALISKSAEKKRIRIQTLEQQMESAKQDMDMALAAFDEPEHQKERYDLAAVFVHRGQGGSKGGHYWIYIRDFERDLWRSYNDSDVRIIEDPKREIFDKRDPSSTGAPYLVVYVAHEQTHQWIDPLFRAAPSDYQVIDVEMENTGEEMVETTDQTMHDASFVEPGEASQVSQFL